MRPSGRGATGGPCPRRRCRRRTGVDGVQLAGRSPRRSTERSEVKGFLSEIRTRPSGRCVIRSCATAGRRTYLQSASRPWVSMAPARVAACNVNRSGRSPACWTESVEVHGAQRSAAVLAGAQRLVVVQGARHQSRQRRVLAPPLGSSGRRLAGDRRRRQRRQPFGVGRLVKELALERGKQTPAAQVLDDARHGTLEHFAHVLRRQVWQRGKPNGRCVQLTVDSVEQEHVKVRIEFQIRARPLHDDHGTALAVGRALRGHARAVEPQHRTHEDPRHRPEQLAVVGESLPPRERHREHPLAKRRGRQDALHQIRRRRGHPPAQARRAKSPTFARKGHQTALAAALALEAAKASTEQAAVQVTLQLLADEAGQRDRDRPLVDRPVERLEVVTHHRVQRRRLGAMAFVDERRACGCRGAPREHRPPCATSAPAPRPCDPATLRRSQSGPARSPGVPGHPRPAQVGLTLLRAAKGEASRPPVGRANRRLRSISPPAPAADAKKPRVAEEFGYWGVVQTYPAMISKW